MQGENPREFILRKIADVEDRNITRIQGLHDLFLSQMFERLETRFNDKIDALHVLLISKIDANRGFSQDRLELMERAWVAALTSIRETIIESNKAAKERTDATFTASEKAIEKAESAQRAINIGQNEWRATVQELTKTTADGLRGEFRVSFAGLTEKVDSGAASLGKEINQVISRIDRSESSGQGQDKQRSVQVTNQTMLLGALGFIMTLVISVGAYLGAKSPVLPPIPITVGTSDTASRMDDMVRRMDALSLRMSNMPTNPKP